MPDDIQKSKEKTAPQEREAEKSERLWYLFNADFGNDFELEVSFEFSH